MRQSYQRWVATAVFVCVLVSGVSCRRSSETPSIANNSSGQDHSSNAIDRGDLKLRYQVRKTTKPELINHTAGTNSKALEKALADLNQRLVLPRDLFISFEDCELPDAFYDPELHQVTICYQLIDDYYDLFSRNIKTKRRLDEAVKAAVAATFFHELGHGLVDVWNIPTTGREEDAVDQLSTLVLIEATEDGERMALDGALSFKLYAELSKGEAKVYWDEHSLDEQRFFDTVCMVYGHNEEKFDYLLKDGTLPIDRAVNCKEDYEKILSSWQRLLGPYLTKTDKPRPKMKVR